MRAGDFIVGFNGQKIVGDGDARSLIAQTRPSQPIVLDIVRKDPNSGEFLPLKLSVKLGKRSSPEGKPFLATLPP
jgi:S1-C subfamily serine protease